MDKPIGLLLASALFCTAVSAQSYLPKKDKQKITPATAASLKVHTFKLQDVRLLEVSPFKHAMEVHE